jgi:hypothetical protein
VLAVACIAGHSSTPSSQPCTPSFPYSEGWLGGDGGYSIPFSKARALWLFGDTFVGRDRATTRAGAQMVSNTIGISDCAGEAWHIDYYWHRASDDHTARAFFNSDDPSISYWPFDGFSYQGNVYLVLTRVVKTSGGGPFGFKTVGTDLAKITNPLVNPDRWPISYSRLTDSLFVFPGASIVLQPPYAYLFGVLDDVTHRRHSVVLTRVALRTLERPLIAIEYLARDGSWKHGLDPRDARILVEDGAPEFSFRFHSEVGKWVLVQQNPRFGSGGIEVRFADKIEGPWSAYRPLAAEPEMTRADAHAKEIFCYAAREHAQFSPGPRSLLLTYACNSLSFRTLAGDMSIYRPVVLGAELP